MPVMTRARARAAAALAAAALLLVGCTHSDLVSPSQPPAGSASAPSDIDRPTIDLSDLDDALKVAPVLDDDAAVTATIGREGGELVATAADGTRFTLTVAQGSLLYATTITMTPVSDLGEVPLGDGPVHAVDLQPSGLYFTGPASLTIEAPTAIPAGELIALGYEGDELRITGLQDHQATTAVLMVPHFSGYGVRRGLIGDSDEVLDRIGGSEEARISARVHALLQVEQQQQLAGADPNPNAQALFHAYLAEYDKLVVQPRLAAAGESCLSGRSILRFYLEIQQSLVLLGIQAEPVGVNEVFDAVLSVCIEEEYRMCVDEHLVHRLPLFWAEVAHFAVFMTFESVKRAVKTVQERAEACVQFELEFTTTSSGQKTAVGLPYSYDYADSASFTAKVALDIDIVAFAESTGTMTSAGFTYTTDIPGCSITTNPPWSAPARFLDLDWIVDAESLNEVGKVGEMALALELPTQVISLGTVQCGSADPVDEGAEGFSAPVVYRLAHDDEIIRDWTIHGGETWATASWEGSGNLDGPFGANMSWQESGTAVLKHTPQ